MSKSAFDPPDWVFDEGSFPPLHSLNDVRREEMYMYSGLVSSEWGHVETGLRQTVYCFLSANNNERPNSRPLADAIIDTNSSFHGMMRLAENLCAVALANQYPLRSSLFLWFRQARAVARHRNAIIHGSLTNCTIGQRDGTMVRGLFICDAMAANSHKAYPKHKKHREIDRKPQSAYYDLNAIKAVLEAIRKLHGNLLLIRSNQYMFALLEGSITPNQRGDLAGSISSVLEAPD